MIVKDIQINDIVSLMLEMEDDRFIVKLYEVTKEKGYREEIIHICDRDEHSLDEMIYSTIDFANKLKRNIL